MKIIKPKRKEGRLDLIIFSLLKKSLKENIRNIINCFLVVEILNKNAAQIATPDVLKVLPDEIPINRISNFLVIALDKAISDRRLYQVNRGLLYAKLLKVKIIILV